MAEYIVSITNGAGSDNIPAGSYDVSYAVTGYDGLLDPTTFTATSGTGSENFTLAATGELTLTVNETGEAGGTPIIDGTFIRCDITGDITYGVEKDVSDTGVCVFNNVPYGTVGTPYVFYIKQLESDTTHRKYDGVITVSMTSDEQAQYVQNVAAAVQSFTLEDEYYSGLTLSGTLTFTDV